MDKRIKLDDYNEIFTQEELRALKTFQEAGYDLIKRADEWDLIIAKCVKKNDGKVIIELEGHFIPEEWFECIDPETEYWFEDIFREEN